MKPIRIMRVSLEMPVPDHEPDLSEGFPWGLHPLLDMLKITSIVAEQQRQLFILYEQQNRRFRIQIYLWIAVIIGSALPPLLHAFL